MTTITLPHARIPLGWVTMDGQSRRIPVEIDIEWMRALLGLVERSGGVTGGESFAAYLPALFDPKPSDPAAEQALRAVDELRNELACAKSDAERLARVVDELQTSLAEIRPDHQLRARVEQIEDRLQ